MNNTTITKLIVGTSIASFGLGAIIGLSANDIETTNASDIDRSMVYVRAYNNLLKQLPNYYVGGGYEGFDTEWAIADIDSFYKLGKEYDRIKRDEKK